MHLDHSIFGVKGRNGFVKFKTKDATIQTDGAKVAWSDIPNENLEFDEKTFSLTIRQKMATYVPVAVYKCLVKMALTIMPEEDVPHFLEYNKVA